MTTRILIRGGDLVPLTGDRSFLPATDVAIEGSRILSVGKIDPTFAADAVVDASGKIVMPAFYNGHCHSPMTFERGWAEDLPLDRWFNERIWVAESALTPEDVYWGAQLAACEMIRSGTVGFNDHYFYMDEVAQVVEKSGMKAGLTWCVFGIGDDKEVGTNLEGTLEFIDRWQGKADGRIRTLLGPHSSYLCPDEFLRDVARLAHERGLGLHIHSAESAGQVEQSRNRYQASPIAHLADCGFFEVDCTIAHGLYLDSHDMALLANPRVTVVRCPITYMKLAMGSSPIAPLLEAGVQVGLGTDGPGSNNDMNMLAVVRQFTLLQKHMTQDAEAVPGDLPLRLATRGSARACGFPDAGVIEAGAPADLILLDAAKPHFRPRHNTVANIVHCAMPGDVTDVMCDGQWLMVDGEIRTLDEGTILEQADRRAIAMVNKNLKIVRQYSED